MAVIVRWILRCPWVGKKTPRDSGNRGASRHSRYHSFDSLGYWGALISREHSHCWRRGEGVGPTSRKNINEIKGAVSPKRAKISSWSWHFCGTRPDDRPSGFCSPS